MRQIDSIKNTYIIELNKLKQNKYRQSQKLFLIEGYHLVEEAHQANLLMTVLITKKDDYIDGVENIIVNESVITKLSQTNSPQGIVGVCRFLNPTNLHGSRYLLLDNIQDPGNVGTLIRTAAAFDIEMVILGDGCADLYNDKTIRATQGALFKIPVIQRNLFLVINELKKKNISIIGTDLEAENELKKIHNLKSYALLLGNEGTGVNPLLLKQTDINVYLRMNKNVESLNVAIAGGIILYYLSN